MSDSADNTHDPVGKADPRTGIFKHGFGLKTDVADSITGDYHSDVVELLKGRDYHLRPWPAPDPPGPRVRVLLRRGAGGGLRLPGAPDVPRPQHLPHHARSSTTPRVNHRLIARWGSASSAVSTRAQRRFDDLTPEDVVILPAFGASVQEVAKLRAARLPRSSTPPAAPSSTCGSAWSSYARDGFTSIIHGKYAHEETIGTSSRATQYPGGHYLIVRDKDEAQLVCDFITGAVDADVIRATFRSAASPRLRPRARPAARRRRQPDDDAQQREPRDRPDAQAALERRARRGVTSTGISAASTRSAPPRRSARTPCSHGRAGPRPRCWWSAGTTAPTPRTSSRSPGSTRAPTTSRTRRTSLSSREIRHKRWNKRDAEVAQDWLPSLPLRVGFTAGASTPNRAVGEVIGRVVRLCGMQLPETPPGG